MNGPNASGDLLFAWESARPRQLAILGFLTASAAGHALCFYLFQIVYPPTVALLPPPARVSLISGNSEEGHTLLRWIAAEDPALASTTQRPVDAKAFTLPKLNHVPSYLTIQPGLKSMPPSPSDLRTPSSQPPAPVPVARASIESAAVPAPTAVSFSEELGSLGAVQKPAMKWTTSIREPPQTSKFLVGVTNRGILQYCFLQRSSGDALLDEQARHYLTLCRFAGVQSRDSAEQNRLHWGAANIEWGNDIVTLPPSPSGDVQP